jgi:hypothetical protein
MFSVDFFLDVRNPWLAYPTNKPHLPNESLYLIAQGIITNSLCNQKNWGCSTTKQANPENHQQFKRLNYFELISILCFSYPICFDKVRFFKLDIMTSSQGCLLVHFWSTTVLTSRLLYSKISSLYSKYWENYPMIVQNCTKFALENKISYKIQWSLSIKDTLGTNNCCP